MNSAHERSFSVWSPLRWWLGPYWPFAVQFLWMASGIAAFSGGGSLFLLFPALLSLYAFLMLWSRDVVVHADGVRISWLGSTRYVPFRSVDRVEPVDRKTPWLMRGRGAAANYLGVALVTGEKKLVLGTSAAGRAMFSNRDARQENELLLRAIEIALQTFRDSNRVTDHMTASHLSRDARTIGDWVSHLKSLVHTDGYRVATISGEQLWKVLEDSTASATARAGAAVALRASLNEEGRARLRVAADAIGSPPLRVAITKLAEESEEGELIGALSQIEDAENEKHT